MDLTWMCGVGFDALYGVDHGRKKLDWVIVGGESGPHYRPLDIAWVRSLREQCRAAGVAYFGKQHSGPKPGMPFGEEALDDKEFPA